jgi:hypothetical protein
MIHAVGAAGIRIARTLHDAFYVGLSGSENYRQGIPLAAQPELTRSERRTLQVRAGRRNRACDGDYAGFVPVKDLGWVSLSMPAPETA